MPTIQQVKERLDSIIAKARVDLYKPIQIAEVLRRSRLEKDINILKLETYQNPSLQWRNRVTRRLVGKVSTSSARYQHDVWSDTAMPPDFLEVLDQENQRTQGGVERYIYLKYNGRQETVSDLIMFIENTSHEEFYLNNLLDRFRIQAGMRRSVDKAYEIIVHSLFETLVVALGTTIRVCVNESQKPLLAEFSDLTRILLGLHSEQLIWETPAHIYRVGVTNAADRGLDMWANFGPAIQVKHLTLNNSQAQTIVDQVESDTIIIVCRDTDAEVINAVVNQISWGKRVRGIVRESALVEWYDKCLRGNFSKQLAQPLMEHLLDGFQSEFPQSLAIIDFLNERGYLQIPEDPIWSIDSL